MTFIPPKYLILALKNAGFTQRKLAELSGTSESQICRFIRDEREMPLGVYMALFALWERVSGETQHDRK